MPTCHHLKGAPTLAFAFPTAAKRPTRFNFIFELIWRERAIHAWIDRTRETAGAMLELVGARQSVL